MNPEKEFEAALHELRTRTNGIACSIRDYIDYLTWIQDEIGIWIESAQDDLDHQEASEE